MFYFRSTPGVIRRIHVQDKQLFLTFDDGPEPEFTPRVLDLLAKHQVRASFFVIGQRARAQQTLLRRILSEGHGVFSHSLDHRYDLYFRGEKPLSQWLKASLQDLEDITQRPQKVFRPPAGILTPPLIRAASALEIPLVLWSHRFFDSTRAWTEKRALRNAQCLQAGDIVLLHDRQKARRRDLFLLTLNKYLQAMQHRGYSWMCLSDSILKHEAQNDRSS